jgi:hypothetical protein
MSKSKLDMRDCLGQSNDEATKIEADKTVTKTMNRFHKSWAHGEKRIQIWVN